MGEFDIVKKPQSNREPYPTPSWRSRVDKELDRLNREIERLKMKGESE